MFIRAVRLDVAVLACVLGTVVLPAASPRSAVPANPDDKTVVHVLNRIGFGPAPGDVERVRRVGLARYIDQQLDPRAIPDSDLAARLAPLTTLKLSTSEIADRYFVPAMMERRRTARLEASESAAPSGAATKERTRTPEARALMVQEREVLSDLAEQKVLRAAYSERQLEEVMVDFWFNHFNVFAGKGADSRLPDRVRARRDPSARARQVPGSAEAHGDRARRCSSTSTTGRALTRVRIAEASAAGMRANASARRAAAQTPQRAERAARPERELRPRADGAAHARRRRRLHAEGRAGSGARASPAGRLRSPRQGGGFRFEPRMHDDGEKTCSATRSRPAAAATTASRCSTSSPRIPRRRVSSRRSWCAASSPTSRPPALVDRAAARIPRDRWRHPRGRAHDRHVARVLRRRAVSRQGEDAVRVRRLAPCARPAPTSANALPLVQAMRELGMPLYSASRRPATPIAPTPGSTPARCSTA